VKRLVIALVLARAFSIAQVSSNISLSNGVQLEIAAGFGAPTGEEKLDVEMARASGNSFYRIFHDQNKLAVFAYELMVDLTPDGSAVRATAKPVETEFAARFPGADAGKPVPSLSSDHPMGPLTTGQSAELGLFEVPGMGLKVTDTIRVKMGQESGAPGPLRFSGIRLSMDRKPVTGAPPPGSVSGRYVMFYVPGSGGFFFSTEQPAGRPFVKAGSIDGAHMQFTIENINYDLTASAPFLANGAGGEVWIYHDPNYRPAGNWTNDLHTGISASPDQFFMAASDSLSWWLPAP
jgi:hypothetical protein